MDIKKEDKYIKTPQELADNMWCKYCKHLLEEKKGGGYCFCPSCKIEYTFILKN